MGIPWVALREKVPFPEVHLEEAILTLQDPAGTFEWPFECRGQGYAWNTENIVKAFCYAAQ